MILIIVIFEALTNDACTRLPKNNAFRYSPTLFLLSHALYYEVVEFT